MWLAWIYVSFVSFVIEGKGLTSTWVELDLCFLLLVFANRGFALGDS